MGINVNQAFVALPDDSQVLALLRGTGNVTFHDQRQGMTEQLAVAEIAYKVGFEDQYYFSRAFKQVFGVPPTKFRNGVDS